MIGLILKRIKNCQTYAQAIGLGKGGWVRVFADYVISYLCYRFSPEDYFVIGNGYTLSKYEKKRFFTIKRAFWVRKKVNDPSYIHFLKNKAEALNRKFTVKAVLQHS